MLTIYYYALRASSELARKDGSYETYNGSPVQFSSAYDQTKVLRRNCFRATFILVGRVARHSVLNISSWSLSLFLIFVVFITVEKQKKKG